MSELVNPNPSEFASMPKTVIYSQSYVDDLSAKVESLEAENARLTEGLEKIKQWSEAYPETIFHVPSDDEWRRAHEAIKAAGMNGIDAFSADSMRRVIKCVCEIVDAALKDHP